MEGRVGTSNNFGVNMLEHNLTISWFKTIRTVMQTIKEQTIGKSLGFGGFVTVDRLFFYVSHAVHVRVGG